jgi:hypothetical protein
MKIPAEIIAEAEAGLQGLRFGRVALEIFMRDGRRRYRTTKETTLMPGNPCPGAAQEEDQL